MDLEFKPGDRVRLTRAGVICHGGAWPNRVPGQQGGGTDGTILFASDRSHMPGAAPRPYFVRRDSGVENAHRIEGLERAKKAEELEPVAPNVLPFRPR